LIEKTGGLNKLEVYASRKGLNSNGCGFSPMKSLSTASIDELSDPFRLLRRSAKLLASGNSKSWGTCIECGYPSCFLGGIEIVPGSRMPQITVAGIQKKAIAGVDPIQSLLSEHGADIAIGDDTRILGSIAFRNRQSTAVQRHSTQHDTSTHEALFGYELDAQRTQPVRSNVLVFEEPAVVEKLALGGLYPDIPRSVELGTNLPQFGRDILVIIDELLRSKRAAGREPGDHHAPTPCAERRCVLCIDLSERDYFTLFNKADCTQDNLRDNQACQTDASFRTPFARRPVFA